MGFPAACSDANMGKKGDCVIPQTLESNVIELHRFLFGEEDYQPSDMVKNISKKISADSGLYKEGKPIESVGTDGGYIPKPTEPSRSTEPSTSKEEEDESGSSTSGTDESVLDYENEWDLETDEFGHVIDPPEDYYPGGTRPSSGTRPGGSGSGTIPYPGYTTAPADESNGNLTYPGSSTSPGDSSTGPGAITQPYPGSTAGTTQAYPGSTKAPTAPYPGSTKAPTTPYPGSNSQNTAPSPGSTNGTTASVRGSSDEYTRRSRLHYHWAGTIASGTSRKLLGSAGPLCYTIFRKWSHFYHKSLLQYNLNTCEDEKGDTWMYNNDQEYGWKSYDNQGYDDRQYNGAQTGPGFSGGQGPSYNQGPSHNQGPFHNQGPPYDPRLLRKRRPFQKGSPHNGWRCSVRHGVGRGHGGG